MMSYRLKAREERMGVGSRREVGWAAVQDWGGSKGHGEERVERGWIQEQFERKRVVKEAM